jgi:hypothetical protein
LLNVLAEFPVELTAILGGDRARLEEYCNVEISKDYDPAALAQYIEHDVSQQYELICSAGSKVERQVKHALKRAVKGAKSGTRLPLYLKLTPPGGAEWELLANPKWTKFHSVTVSGGESRKNAHSVAIEARSKRRIMEAMAALPDLGITKIGTKTTWRSLSPWQATYWKQIPTGWRATFDGKENGSIPPIKSKRRVELGNWFAEG